MNKKKGWQRFIGFAIMLVGGGACGYFVAWYMDTRRGAAEASGNGLFYFGLELLLVCAAVYGQIILHEAGHLVFGLFTGYQFSSFRVGKIMFSKIEGKLRVSSMHIAGTGGQCLMVPPDMEDGRIPIMLYNFGGSIMNVVTGLLFLGAAFLLPEDSLGVIFCLVSAGIGFVFAAVNGIPLHMGAIDNDGCNALSLGKDKKALRSFWVQLKVSDRQTKGERLKDMPEEWFEVPSDEDMQNTMTAVMGVFAANRLMDEHRFEEADTLMERLINMKSGIGGLHRYLLLCDRLYYELIYENRPEIINRIWDKSMKKFARNMKAFPSIIRTEYALALLHDKDEAAAEKLLARFEKAIKKYPYTGDVQAERELIVIAQEAARARQGGAVC